MQECGKNVFFFVLFFSFSGGSVWSLVHEDAIHLCYGLNLWTPYELCRPFHVTLGFFSRHYLVTTPLFSVHSFSILVIEEKEKAFSW